MARRRRASLYERLDQQQDHDDQSPHQSVSLREQLLATRTVALVSVYDHDRLLGPRAFLTVTSPRIFSSTCSGRALRFGLALLAERDRRTHLDRYASGPTSSLHPTATRSRTSRKTIISGNLSMLANSLRAAWTYGRTGPR